MSEQLITVGEATKILGVTSDLPANKCLTKAEFDELVAQKSGLTPELAPNGVYIMHKDRKLFRIENWTYPNEDASGVAVKTDNYSFVIAKENSVHIKWSTQDVLINNCTTTKSESIAKKDYNGKQNTDAIVSQLGTSDTYAARYCKEYTFPHGVQGYLPAVGEWMEVYKYKIEIDVYMSLIGGDALDNGLQYNALLWCSTQEDEADAWYTDWRGKINSYYKSANYNTCYARPFAAFK